MNQTTEYQEYPRENREHKSTLFCKVFENKEHLLDLYNCVNNTAYQNADDLEVNTLENVVYECEARMLNINYGKNRALLENCRRLEEYSIFVAKVREYATADIENRESAIIRAIDECIEAGILADILIGQKAEVLELMLTTFNKELYEQGLKEEGAREADQRVADLEQQNKVLQNSVAEKDAELAEKNAVIANLKAQLGVNE